LTVYNGDLIAAGKFTMAGDVGASCISRWDGSSWHPLGSGPNTPTIRVLMVWNDLLIAGGDFAEMDGIPALHIAAWDGESWSPLGSGLSAGTVFTLTTYLGDLIAGGNFGNAGGVSAQNISRWDGTIWSPLGDGLDDSVLDLVADGADLFACGVFHFSHAIPVYHVAKYNSLTWPRWRSIGFGFTGWEQSVNGMALFNGDLIVGGYFHHAGGVGASNIARWDRRDWHPMGSGVSLAVSAIATYGSDLYVGGDIHRAGQESSYNIARWVEQPSAVPDSHLIDRSLLHVSNPYRPNSEILLGPITAREVDVSIYDIQGRLIRRLLDAVGADGVHSIRWDGRSDAGLSVSPGVYFLRARIDGIGIVRSVVLIR
jgi:hypothetical protein